MWPVRTAWTEVIYRGRGEVGDLYCHREQPGQIWTVWEPSAEERALLADGGRVRLTVWSEPIPPVTLDVLNAEESAPVSRHPFKVIPELDDLERQ